MKLYVIRHGETNVNVKNLINGRNMIGLNKNGKRQAVEAGNIISKLDIDLIICSPLRRTAQTCRLINKNKVKVIYDRRIMERDAGNMQFRTNNVIDTSLWYDINKDVIYKNTEGFKSVLNRATEVIQEIKTKYDGNSILLVTHGDFSKAIRAHILGLTDSKEIRECSQKNCEILEYDI